MTTTQARKFFVKATSIDPGFGAAWIAFGHTFAEKDEHEQALSAYRYASGLLCGCHIPHLCIGIELVRTEKRVNLRGFFFCFVFHAFVFVLFCFFLFICLLIFSHSNFHLLPSEARQVLSFTRGLYNKDPLLHNEIGVVSYLHQAYEPAAASFLLALGVLCGEPGVGMF